MNDRIREYVDGLFTGVPMTKESIDFREEVLQNLYEKYNDLIAQGSSEADAYSATVSSVGDIQSVLRDLGASQPSRPAAATAVIPAADTQIKTNIETEAVTERQKTFAQDERKARIMTAIGVALCILCPVPVLLKPGAVGVVLMFILVAAGVALFILTPNPKQKYRNNVTMAEEFQQWKTEKQGVQSQVSGIHTIICTAAVALYFLLSFATGAWSVTWIIFLMAPCLCEIASAALRLKR